MLRWPASDSSPAAALSSSTVEPAPVAVAEPDAGSTILTRAASRASLVARDVALSIPAVRKARHVIIGTIGTFGLEARQAGELLEPADPRVAWLLSQPDPQRTLQWILTKTADDLLWYDRCVWRITDRTLYGRINSVERIAPTRIDTRTHPLDEDTVEAWIIDGQETSPANLIVFDGAGIGGLRRFGFPLLDLYGKLQAAAGRYADAPHPHAILKNHGADLDNTEIDDLLNSWERARSTRSIGYLNEVMDYETHGYSARELQLTEGREHGALEVARLFGLPATALDAPTGDSMTYGNVVDRRKDIREALRPWTSCIEQTLSMDDRRGLSLIHI